MLALKTEAPLYSLYFLMEAHGQSVLSRELRSLCIAKNRNRSRGIKSGVRMQELNVAQRLQELALPSGNLHVSANKRRQADANKRRGCGER